MDTQIDKDDFNRESAKMSHVIEVSGALLTGVNVVLTIGAALPVVGNICETLQSLSQVCEARYNKVKDVMEVAKRVVDVGKFLAKLDSVVQSFHELETSEESSMLHELNQAMLKLNDSLKEMLEAVYKLNKGGFLKAMVMGNGVKKLSKLDNEVTVGLEKINELYNLARDKSIASSLSVLLARTSNYKLETQVDAIVCTIGSKVHEPGQMLSDEDIRRDVLSDPNILKQLEVEGGLSSDVVQEELELLINLDKKMDVMISMLYSMMTKKTSGESNITRLQPEFMRYLFNNSLNDVIPFFQAHGIFSLQLTTNLSADNLIEMGIPVMRAGLIVKKLNAEVANKAPEQVSYLLCLKIYIIYICTNIT